jgi:hypothetical protein
VWYVERRRDTINKLVAVDKDDLAPAHKTVPGINSELFMTPKGKSVGPVNI